MGLNKEQVRQLVATGRLHPKWPGVYVVGRSQLARRGEWIAALMTCGPGAVLSHFTAAVLWRLWATEPPHIHVSIPASRQVRPRHGVFIHRRSSLEGQIAHSGPIPVTKPLQTLVDVAGHLDREPLEAAVNEAIRRKLTSPDRLRANLDRFPSQPGVARLRRLLDIRTFRLTDSALERLFIPIALRAGLARPLTQQHVNGYRVDFYWPGLGLVVETDGGSFHTSAAQQTRDRRRDQAHFAAGLLPLRFMHYQIKYESSECEALLAEAQRRLTS